VVYNFWVQTNIPKGIPEDAFNRFNSGFFANSLPGIGFAMFESYLKLRDDYASCKIATPCGLFIEYVKFLLVSVIGSSIWAGVWWLPSVALDLWVAPLLNHFPIVLVNLVLSLSLLFIISRIGNTIRKCMLQKKKRQQQEQSKSTPRNLKKLDTQPLLNAVESNTN